MIPFKKAYEIVMNSARQVGTERVNIDSALHRVSAEDVKSDMDMPPFNKSAMDGYACRRKDLGNVLTIVETIPAGKVPGKHIGENECAGIMTGAIVSPGADCVIQVEHTEKVSETRTRFTGSSITASSISDNICRKGEDIRAGDIVLQKGKRILSQHIGILAAVGCVRILVARRPVVGIIATGNEIVEPGKTPGISQIRNSNGYQLYADVTNAGAVPRYYGIANDTETALDMIIKRSAAKSDVTLLSGGVSMGDYDFVPGIFVKNGFRLLFEKIAVKPGMPTVFGVADKTFCFGLPGNPVSTFVIFEILVKPFLFKLMGHDYLPSVVSMRLTQTIARKKSNRDFWLPVRRTGKSSVSEIEYHGSAHLNALSDADGLICIPRGVTEIQQGAFVDVRQI